MATYSSFCVLLSSIYPLMPKAANSEFGLEQKKFQ